MDVETDLARNSDPYRALGVKPFINCCSVRTIHGGSVMLPQVREAVAAASRQFVNLDELMEAAGQRIAELTGAEWGMVTCGSAAALALATAACVAGNDPIKMLRLPFTAGMANEVVMLTGQRFAYDQAVRMVGTHVIECDNDAELGTALARDTVAMVCVLGKQAAKSWLPFEELVARARARGIPILVDAASEHIERPSPWLARGADLVIYSGGKFLRGPQTSGLLLGSKPLVQAAWRNAAPHHAFGRPMKVSKEDVIGVVAALEYWVETRDRSAEDRRWRDDLDAMAAALDGTGASCTIVAPEGTIRVPSLAITWNPAEHPIGSLALRRALLDGTPRIMLSDLDAGAHSVMVEPFNLQPGEARAVGHAIAAVLRAARTAAPAAERPAINVAGRWQVTVAFLRGQRVHDLVLEQDGARALRGTQRSDQFDGAVHGQVSGTDVAMTF